MKVNELRELIASKPAGTKLNIATSQYTDKVWCSDEPIHAHSSAGACRAVIKQGLVTGFCGWRYYELEVL
jgi:hypothetical protein